MSMVDHVAVSIERLMVDLPIGAVACIPVIPQVQHARSFLTSMGVKPNASALLSGASRFTYLSAAEHKPA